MNYCAIERAELPAGQDDRARAELPAPAADRKYWLGTDGQRQGRIDRAGGPGRPP